MPTLITVWKKNIALTPTASTAPKRSLAWEATFSPHMIRKK